MSQEQDIWLAVIMQHFEDAQGEGLIAGDARAWLGLKCYAEDREMVHSMAGVSFECGEAYVRSKPWYYETYEVPVPTQTACPVCSETFTIARKGQKCCSPKCQSARKVAGQRRRYRARVS